MCVSKALVATVVLTAVPVRAADLGRLGMLAGEAEQLLGPTAAAATEGNLLLLLVIPAVTMLAAFLGTWFGIRTLSFGRLREKQGWREVAYRFRSDGPLTMGKDVIQRMTGVLDEIEDLGAKLKGTAPVSAAPVSAESTPSAATHAGPTSSASPESSQRQHRTPVTFARREAPVTVPATEAAPQPIVRTDDRPFDRSADRGTRYEKARAMLRDGLDRETVRSMTGLKLAELDLLRYTPEPLGAKS